MLSDKENKVLMETRLRNLKRKQSRIINHPDLTQTALELQKEIDNIENQLAMK